MKKNKNSIGIIIQARTQSTRLPKKTIISFYQNDCILSIIIKRLKNVLDHVPIVVATSNKPEDDIIASLVNSIPSVGLFRGDEKNVLDRFIRTAEKYSLDSIIRVCADNPFIDVERIKELIANLDETHDYVSFKLADNTPVIKSHQGLWAELVKLEALKTVISLTNDNLFLEHVTNYIYTHEEIFNVKLMPAPDYLYERNDIRLTIDTPEDFKNAQYIYNTLIENRLNINTKNIINLLNTSPKLLLSMKEIIKENTK